MYEKIFLTLIGGSRASRLGSFQSFVNIHHDSLPQSDHLECPLRFSKSIFWKVCPVFPQFPLTASHIDINNIVPDVRLGVARSVRFSRLRHVPGRVECERSGALLVLHVRDARRVASDHQMAALLALLRTLPSRIMRTSAFLCSAP